MQTSEKYYTRVDSDEKAEREPGFSAVRLPAFSPNLRQSKPAALPARLMVEKLTGALGAASPQNVSPTVGLVGPLPPRRSEHVRNHPLRSLRVFHIFRVGPRHQSLLAQHPRKSTEQQHDAQQEIQRGPMCENACPAEEARGRVDRMADIAVRARGDESTGR